MLEKNNLMIDDIDWFVFYSVNMCIIEVICKGIGLLVEKVFESFFIYGNIFFVFILLALNEGVKVGKVKKGDKVMFFGFGGGFFYVGIIVEWGV